jgi:hypothetical protein
VTAGLQTGLSIRFCAPNLACGMKDDQAIAQGGQRPGFGCGPFAFSASDTHVEGREFVVLNTLQEEQAFVPDQRPPLGRSPLAACNGDTREGLRQSLCHALCAAMGHAKGLLDVLKADTVLACGSHIGQAQQFMGLGEGDVFHLGCQIITP